MWGFQARRKNLWKNEISYLTPIPREVLGQGHFRSSLDATLVEIGPDGSLVPEERGLPRDELDEQEFELSVAGALYGGDARDSLDYENSTFSWIFETYLEGLQARLRRTTHPREGANMIHHERGEQ